MNVRERKARLKTTQKKTTTTKKKNKQINWALASNLEEWLRSLTNPKFRKLSQISNLMIFSQKSPHSALVTNIISFLARFRLFGLSNVTSTLRPL